MISKLHFVSLLVCSIAGISGFLLHWNDAVKEEQVKQIVKSILSMKSHQAKCQLVRIDSHHLLLVPGSQKQPRPNSLERFLKGETDRYDGLDSK